MQQLQSDGSYNELYPKTDAWTKDETLSAQVASVLGLRDDYKPDDAFLGLYFGGRTYRYQVQVLYENGTPAQGFTVTGLTSIGGLGLVTNEKGLVLGSSTNQTVTIRIESPYIDQKAPESQIVNSTGVLTKVILQLTNIVDTITKTGSFSANVSPVAKTIDVTIVGGGGHAGQNSDSFASGGGGGGGYVATSLLKNISSCTIKAAVGAGGKTVPNFKRDDGGATSFFINNNKLIEAAGGSGGNSDAGGSGNGAGGNGYPSRTAGGDSTGYIFNDLNLGLAGGGGRGAGASKSDLAGSFPVYGKQGGSPNGGKGGDVTSNSGGTNGLNGSVMGGGGGGGAAGYHNGYWNTIGGKRADGGVYLRFHF